MTTTNMFLNFGGEWDSLPLLQYALALDVIQVLDGSY